MRVTKSSVAVGCIGLAATCLAASVAQSGQPKSSQGASPTVLENRRSAWLHGVYLKDASGYRFAHEDDRSRSFVLQHKPIMRWTSGGDFQGELYVWVDQGRAAVVGCIFSSPLNVNTRRVMHEFHSLETQPIVAEEQGETGWQPTEAGVVFQAVPDAGVPAARKPLRLAQMRELALRFSSHMMRNNTKHDLRLLPQPLYRYEIKSETSQVVDGAVFAYVWTEGTDPEVLLVLEARRERGEVRWQYALARFTNRVAWVNYQDREVWRVAVPTAGNFDGITSRRYGTFSVKSVTVPADAR